MRAIGIAIPFIRRRSGVTIDAQAQAHYDRVIADGGAVPSGLNGVNAFFTAIKTIYATADITTAISAAYDPQYLGYKLGAGSGTTLGQAAQKLYSCSGVSGDVVQTTAASQPLLLAHTGANYYKGVAVAENSCSAPKSLTQTDTLDFITKIDLIDGATFSGYAIGTLDNSTTSRQFYVFYGSGSFGLFYGNGLAQTANATTATARYNGWLRITIEKSGANSLVKFYKSEETSITNPSLVTWTQIGATVTGTYAAMSTTASQFNILSGGQSSNCSNAKVYYAHIAETIGGAPLAVFNPASYNPATSQTQWTSATGEVWSLNVGTATSGYKSALVTKSIVQGDGIDDRLTSGTLTSRTSFTVYIAVNALSFSGRFMDGNLALTKTLYGTSSNISMFGGGGGFDFVGETPQRLQMLTANFQAAPNVYARVNNNARATTASSIGNSASTGINLFTDGGGANPANVMITTLIQSTTNDPLNDNMYNYIRSINNNAF